MGLIRGQGALKAMRDAAPKKGGSGGMTLRIGDGEKAIVRFWGTFEGGDAAPDPVYAKKHNRRRVDGSTEYEWCGQNDDAHAGCSYCYVGDAQSAAERNGVGGIKTQTIGLLYVKDYRKQHKFDTEVKGPDGKPTKYPPCNAPKPCQYCRLNNEARPRGYMPFELNEWFMGDFKSWIINIGTFCLCNGRDENNSGPIYPTRTYCADCEADVEVNENGLARCPNCKTTKVPTEEIACLCCDNPQRATIQDAIFGVLRTGKGTNTKYGFELVRIEPPSAEEIEEAMKYEPKWESHCKPKSSEEQAQQLGLPESPFHTEGHGAKPFGQKLVRNEPNGLLCSDCGEPQVNTPSGPSCKFGHGGADGVKPVPKQLVRSGVVLNKAQTSRTQSAKPNLSNVPKKPMFGKKPQPVVEEEADEETMYE
jgi:hypothetical protein